MTKPTDDVTKKASAAVKEKYAETFQALANNVSLPKWAEDVARSRDNFAANSDGYGHFLAGVRLVLEKLEQTKGRGFHDATPDYQSYEQGRESVRKEILDE